MTPDPPDDDAAHRSTAGAAASAATADDGTGPAVAPRRVLVLGATGYVGGRLAPRLVAAGHRVRCLARDPDKLHGLPWATQAEIVAGDLLEPSTLGRAFADVDVVYHLVHSMGGGRDFADRDRRIAATVAEAAAAAIAGRIVYLGGLHDDGDDAHASEHLTSRAEVGAVLADGPVPVTVLRAAVIIGSGSASFEMLRYLVETLPVMVTPRWVHSRVQPIAIRDVLRYLVGVLAVDDADDHTYDIGGPDVLTYRDMMRTYAEVARLPRRMIVPVPVLTPSLSSHWVGLVTPVPASIARPLVDGLVNDAVSSGAGEDITAVVPGACLPYRRALELALRRVRDHEVETSWREADYTGRGPAEPYPGDPDWSGGTLYADVRHARSVAPPDEVFRVVCGIGGDAGWPTHRWAWQIRGLLDRLVGGIGLRRGRRDPDELRVGDALDFWRVVDVDLPDDDGDGLLRLYAEMRLPGDAWLEFRVTPDGAGTWLRQRALYAPRGLVGRLYWWVLWPFHGWIFPAMVRAVAAQADDEVTHVDRDMAADGGVGAGVTSSDGPTARRVARGGGRAAAGRRRRPARRAG